MRILPSIPLALALCGAAGGLQTSLRAQVVINEINFAPQFGGDDQWIEIINLGQDAQDVSNWSIYLATKTVNKPQNYWFGMPTGTIVPGETIMRIHWGAEIKTPTNPLDIQTGISVKNFLFGLGFEPLDPKRGALALMNTNLNSGMNNASSFEDWISWGESGFAREDLAVKAGLWTANQFMKAPTAKESIALASFLQAEPTPNSAYFLDHTPTPGVGNYLGFFADTYGKEACAQGSAKPAKLWYDGVPTDGNEDFAFTIDNTRGPIFREQIFLLINTDVGGSQTFINCPVHVKSIESSIIVGPFPAEFNTTRIPISLNFPKAGGIWLDYQVFVGSVGTFDISMSNLMEILIGL
jgi:hypothetical protein